MIAIALRSRGVGFSGGSHSRQIESIFDDDEPIRNRSCPRANQYNHLVNQESIRRSRTKRESKIRSKGFLLSQQEQEEREIRRQQTRDQQLRRLDQHFQARSQRQRKLDQDNPLTVRGGKLRKDRIVARDLFKLQVLLAAISVIGFIVLKFTSHGMDEKCGLNFTCECTSHIKNFNHAYTCTMVALIAQLGWRFIAFCRSIQPDVMRRRVKLDYRITTCIFGFLYLALYVLMVYTYKKFEDSCQDTSVLNEIVVLARILMAGCGLNLLFMIGSTIYVLVGFCRRVTVRFQSGAYESSDEVDDREFNQRTSASLEKDREHLQNRIERQVQPQLMSQLRGLLDRMSQQQRTNLNLQLREREDLIDRMIQIENQISRIAKRSKDLALKKYIACLLQVKHCNYNEKELDDKCVVCQSNFKGDDDLVIFECNPKHYFHKSCGLEWLDLKTECPLCRMDFTEQIMNHVVTNVKQQEPADPQEAQEERKHVEGVNLDADEETALRMQQVEADQHLRELHQTIQVLRGDMQDAVRQDNQNQRTSQNRRRQANADVDSVPRVEAPAPVIHAEQPEVQAPNAVLLIPAAINVLTPDEQEQGSRYKSQELSQDGSDHQKAPQNDDQAQREP